MRRRVVSKIGTDVSEKPAASMFRVEEQVAGPARPFSQLRLFPRLLEAFQCSPTTYIETGYGLDGRDSVLGRGNIFVYSTASSPALGPIQCAREPFPWG
jgi:hypothetical protein